MGKTINIIQQLHEHYVNNTIVNKIYNMPKRKDEYHEDTINDIQSNFIGEVSLAGQTYADIIFPVSEYQNN